MEPEIKLCLRDQKVCAPACEKKFHYFTVKGPYLKASDKLIWPSNLFSMISCKHS